MVVEILTQTGVTTEATAKIAEMTKEGVMPAAAACIPFERKRTPGDTSVGSRRRSSLGEVQVEKIPVPAAVIPNNGWGELFKNRDNFVDMHLF